MSCVYCPKCRALIGPDRVAELRRALEEIEYVYNGAVPVASQLKAIKKIVAFELLRSDGVMEEAKP